MHPVGGWESACRCLVQLWWHILVPGCFDILIHFWKTWSCLLERWKLQLPGGRGLVQPLSKPQSEAKPAAAKQFLVHLVVFEHFFVFCSKPNIPFSLLFQGDVTVAGQFLSLCQLITRKCLSQWVSPVQPCEASFTGLDRTLVPQAQQNTDEGTNPFAIDIGLYTSSLVLPEHLAAMPVLVLGGLGLCVGYAAAIWVKRQEPPKGKNPNIKHASLGSSQASKKFSWPSFWFWSVLICHLHWSLLARTVANNVRSKHVRSPILCVKARLAQRETLTCAGKIWKT